MLTNTTQTSSFENWPPRLEQLDLSRHFDIISPRVERLGEESSAGKMPLVDEKPADSDRIIAEEFSGDATVRKVGDEIRAFLLGRAGAVVATLARPGTVNSLTLRKRQLVLGYALGTNANHHSEEQPDRALFEISPRLNVRYGGNGENASSIGPHTDGSGVDATIDVLGLGCITQAVGTGGQTLVCNAQQAVLTLSAWDKTALSEAWPRTNPYNIATAAENFVRRAIATLRVPFEFSYHPQRIRQALDRCGEATLDRLQILARLDDALWRHSTGVRLNTGELLLVNNRRFGHGRIGFVHDPRAPRRLERQWITWRLSDAGRLPIRRVD